MFCCISQQGENPGFGERGSFLRVKPYIKSSKKPAQQARVSLGILNLGCFFNRGPYGIKTDFSPTKVRAEVKKNDIPNALDAGKRTPQI